MARRASRWMLALLLLLPGCATTGAIRGTLVMPAPEAKTGGVSASPTGVLSPAPERVTDAVIYLEPAPVAGQERAPAVAEPMVAQVNHGFVPRVLPVVTGTTVRFENHDAIYHNVFSVSPAKRFDVGKYAPHEKRRVTFDRPGVVELFCDIDPAMAGFVLVVPHRIFTQPDATGAFALPQVPRGAYTLEIWHPGLGRASRKVEMPSKGDLNVTLRF